VFGRFPDARVLSLTATPFRSDDQPVEGEVIYRYTFRDAMQRGYIKDIQSVNVA
jgi:DNA repair protein RadD